MQRGVPCAQALYLRKVAGQVLQPIGFFTLGPGEMGAEPCLDFRLGQHFKHLGQGQGRLIIQPAQSQQRRSRLRAITDFRVVELACAKVLPLAHDHAHPERLGGIGQQGKTGDELLLFGTEDIAVAGRDPAEHVLEILQVIKRIFKRIGNHGQDKPLVSNTGYAYRYQFARCSGKPYWMSGAGC